LSEADGSLGRFYQGSRKGQEALAPWILKFDIFLLNF